LGHSCKISCNEFAQSGPEAFPLEPKEEIDATTGGGHLIIAFVETDRDLTKPPTDAVLTPEITNYDANNAAPEAYVGVAYV